MLTKSLYFCILSMSLEATSVLHRRKTQPAHPTVWGFGLSEIVYNHHQEAVVGSMAQAMTQVVVFLRCKLPTIAFFIFSKITFKDETGGNPI